MTRKRELPTETAAETFVPAVSFTGYPDGKTPVQFFAGVESAPVPAEFAQLMREKGLVSIPEGEI
jgi:hypothetical protein